MDSSRRIAIALPKEVPAMPTWFRRRRLAARLAQADADALIRDHGAQAYWEARRRERDVVLPDGTTHAGRTPAHWRRVALIVAKRTGHRVGLDTATRMLMDRENEKDAGEVSADDEIRRLTGR
jgi:hypothetical protein